MLARSDQPPPALSFSEKDGVDDIEQKLRIAVAERVGPAKFGLWFGDEVRLGVDGDALRIAVPNGFFREWIHGHFSGSLIEAAEAVVGRPLKLAFQIEAEPVP